MIFIILKESSYLFLYKICYDYALRFIRFIKNDVVIHDIIFMINELII